MRLRAVGGQHAVAVQLECQPAAYCLSNMHCNVAVSTMVYAAEHAACTRCIVCVCR